MKEDIEQKSEELIIKFSNLNETGLGNTDEELAEYIDKKALKYTEITIQCILEERERGKRFTRWLNENYALYDEIDFTWLDKETNMDIKNIDQLFDIFLLEEKALNN